MIDPKIKTEVRHSQTKNAWNIVAVAPLGGKFKIARIPYLQTAEVITDLNFKWKKEALEHAEFINWCFNHSEEILKMVKQ